MTYTFTRPVITGPGPVVMPPTRPLTVFGGAMPIVAPAENGASKAVNATN
jgi:hypothetical protein